MTPSGARIPSSSVVKFGRDSANVHLLPNHRHGFPGRHAGTLVTVANDVVDRTRRRLQRGALFTQRCQDLRDGGTCATLAFDTTAFGGCAFFVSQLRLFGGSKLGPVCIDEANLGTAR